MVRFLIIGVVLAVAFSLYALVDAAMTESSRARGASKPVWIVLVAVFPVVGAALWFTLGKASREEAQAAASHRAPDDDPRFTGTRMNSEDLDRHVQDLEQRLRELDTEVYPGETPDTSPHGSDEPKQP